MPFTLSASDPRYWETLFDRNGPSKFETALANAQDFEEAMTLARAQYRRTLALHRKTGGDPAGTAFWQQQANEADAVLRQWKRLHGCPTARCVFALWLHKQGLWWYASAFTEGTGESFARELGF